MKDLRLASLPVWDPHLPTCRRALHDSGNTAEWCRVLGALDARLASVAALEACLDAPPRDGLLPAEEAVAHLLQAVTLTHRVIECACVVEHGAGWGTRAGGAIVRAGLSAQFASTDHLSDDQRAELAEATRELTLALHRALSLARRSKPAEGRAVLADAAFKVVPRVRAAADLHGPILEPAARALALVTNPAEPQTRPSRARAA